MVEFSGAGYCLCFSFDLGDGIDKNSGIERNLRVSGRVNRLGDLKYILGCFLDFGSICNNQ